MRESKVPLSFTISSTLLAKHRRFDQRYYADLIEEGKLRVNERGEVVEAEEELHGEKSRGETH